jgi:cystathionine beta-lyase
VALTDGVLCGAAGEQFVRLNVATPRSVLVQAVQRMGAALAAG